MTKTCSQAVFQEPVLASASQAPRAYSWLNNGQCDMNGNFRDQFVYVPTAQPMGDDVTI